MLTIHELHEKLVRRDVSAVEVTKAFLAHKDTVEPKVRAFLSDSREGALKGAAAVDAKIAAGETIADLAGIPGAIKDNICIEGQQRPALRRSSNTSKHRTMPRSSKNWPFPITSA